MYLCLNDWFLFPYYFVFLALLSALTHGSTKRWKGSERVIIKLLARVGVVAVSLAENCSV